jgi:flagellar biosynthetic protein FlhB
VSGEEEGAEKSHEPSERKLEEARRKGEIARGRDLWAAAGFAGLLLAMVATGAAGVRAIGTAGAVVLDQADRLAALMVSDGAAALAGLAGAVALAALPFFALPAIATLAAIVAQQGLVFAPDKLAPKLARISPLAGIRNRFGVAGLFEFAKSFIKLVAVSAVLGAFLVFRMTPIMGSMYLSPGLASATLARLLVEFLVLIVVLQGAIGALDFLFQRADHRRRQMMSRRELLEEMRQAEGDPHFKAERRQRAVDIATNRMLSDVPKADVVIVNPTHYAVALQWKRGSGRAPVCVAKGVDEIAARIRERAAEAGVPIHRDPPTARALHAGVEIGAEIRPEHYRPVAAAIRFADTLRARARSRGWGRGRRAGPPRDGGGRK